MTKPTPTDVDRGETTPFEAFLEPDELARLDWLLAQARREGEEAMREKAAKLCDVEVETQSEYAGYHTAELLAEDIRALPTGEES